MGSATKRIVVFQNIDEQGELEEFTWDLYPLVDSKSTLHLHDNGLPKVGTVVRAGMILVAKSGRGKAFNPKRMPDSLEWNGFITREEFAAKYKKLLDEHFVLRHRGDGGNSSASLL